MLHDITIPLDRAWNTWSERPAEMVFLPLGVRLTPLAYSAHAQRATVFPPGPDLVFGAHALDGSAVDTTLQLGATRVLWSWRKHGPYAVSGTWRTLERGEWGLRFWLNLCVSAAGGDAVRFANGAAVVRVGTRYVAVCSSHPPVQVTGHDSIEAVAGDYEQNGYFHLGSRAAEAPVLALRFNLEMMAEATIAAAVGDDPLQATERARALAAPRDDTGAVPGSAPVATLHSGQFAGALDAVRDVMGWNGVYDQINRRPYTCISRNWNQCKFGGFGVWLDDQFYHALATGLLDTTIARENLGVALANATPQGNFACLVTAADAWIDRTQIPVGSFIVRLLAERSGDRSLAAAAYATLLRNHEWWWATRDPLGCGLVSYGSSDLGSALYMGTSFGARNESSMDNSPTHDEAQFDPATRTLTTLDVGLNSLLALDAQCLAALARLLGHDATAVAIEARGEALRLRIQTELWDESRGIFANRLRDGRFVRSVGPTSFFPMVCGAASPDQITRLLVHLDDPAEFAGRFPLPSVTRGDPAFADNCYWRGRIWPPLNFLVWHGLRRNGLDDRASRLARESFELFRLSWEGARLCPENYNADTGAALDQPDTEGFYGWGVLMPVMAVAEILDVNPWGGWEISNGGQDVVLGPLQTPCGLVNLEIRAGLLQVRRGAAVLLSTDVPGRISRLRIEDGYLSMQLPASLARAGTLTLPTAAGRQVLVARLGTRDVALAGDGSIAIPADAAGSALTVVYR
jgi:putative isomerase